MNLKEGDTGVITFGDNTTAKVKVVEVVDYHASGMPTDIFFTYAENETNKKIKHPTLGEKFPLPIGIVNLVFVKD
jgi:hypothetical protein